jgi:hypothetical protein
MNGPDEVTRRFDDWVPAGQGTSDTMPGPPAAVELHIEELLLHGFAPGDRYRIADSVEGELSRLVARQGLASLAGALRPIERLDAGAFRLASGDGPDQVGLRIARHVYSRLSTVVPRHPHQGSTTERIRQ